MDEQRHDGDAAASRRLVEPRERRPYARPELVRYGALQEVTRAYTQTRSCAGGICETA